MCHKSYMNSYSHDIKATAAESNVLDITAHHMPMCAGDPIIMSVNIECASRAI